MASTGCRAKAEINHQSQTKLIAAAFKREKIKGARALEKSLSFFKQKNQCRPKADVRPKAAVRGGLWGSSPEEMKISRSKKFALRATFLTIS